MDALQLHGQDDAILRLRLAHATGLDVAFGEDITSREAARKQSSVWCLAVLVSHD